MRPKQRIRALRRFWNNKFQSRRFLLKKWKTEGVLKSPIFKDTAVSWRKIEVALPVELSRAEQLALVRSFVKDNFVDAGILLTSSWWMSFPMIQRNAGP